MTSRWTSSASSSSDQLITSHFTSATPQNDTTNKAKTTSHPPPSPPQRRTPNRRPRLLRLLHQLRILHAGSRPTSLPRVRLQHPVPLSGPLKPLRHHHRRLPDLRARHRHRLRPAHARDFRALSRRMRAARGIAETVCLPGFSWGRCRRDVG